MACPPPLRSTPPSGSILTRGTTGPASQGTKRLDCPVLPFLTTAPSTRAKLRFNVFWITNVSGLPLQLMQLMLSYRNNGCVLPHLSPCLLLILTREAFHDGL